ncbi:hypothetical protein [Cochlodiniinecator piscidefendens]|nr:hypothetical protein [Cochlodiniinecator piscidefendens]
MNRSTQNRRLTPVSDAAMLITASARSLTFWRFRRHSQAAVDG